MPLKRTAELLRAKILSKIKSIKFQDKVEERLNEKWIMV